MATTLNGFVGWMGIVVGLWSGLAHAHSVSGVFDPGGNNPHATVYADITCFDDGNGLTAGLYARIKDLSEPVTGLLINLQLQKGNGATNTGDPVSGDADFGSAVILNAGDGVYRLLINKTAAGARQVELEYHCLTTAGVHTGTDAVARQVQ